MSDSIILPPLGEIPKILWEAIEGSLLEPLGSGSTATVFRGLWNGQQVAVKILSNIPGYTNFNQFPQINRHNYERCFFYYQVQRKF
jgi:hypothetical protein